MAKKPNRFTANEEDVVVVEPVQPVDKRPEDEIEIEEVA